MTFLKITSSIFNSVQHDMQNVTQDMSQVYLSDYYSGEYFYYFEDCRLGMVILGVEWLPHNQSCIRRKWH